MVSRKLWADCTSSCFKTINLPHNAPFEIAGGPKEPNWATWQIAHYDQAVSLSCEILHGG